LSFIVLSFSEKIFQATEHQLVLPSELQAFML
jgi:hypothetical protein